MRSMVSLGDLIAPAKLRRAGNADLPILSMTMRDGLVDQANKFKKRIASADTSPYKRVLRGQLVVGFPIDEGVLSFQMLHDEAIVSPAYDVWDVRQRDIVDVTYLERVLRSTRALVFYRSKLQGTTARRRTLPDDIFLSLPVLLPPIDEQRHINAILEKVDNLRRKRLEAVGLADHFLRALFVDMFGDPVTNPLDWAIAKVDVVCEDIVDCVNKTAPVVDEVTPFKMIRTTNVRNRVLDLSSTRCVSADTFGRWTQRILPRRGDIVFTREAPVGEAGIVESDEQLFLGQRTMLYRPDLNKVLSTFLLYELMASGVQAQIAKASSGSTVKHLSVPVCKEFTVRIPPLGLQQRFEAIAKRVRSIGSTNEAALMAVEALQKSLQADLFT